MKAIILIFVLLQLSLITPNPNSNKEPHPNKFGELTYEPTKNLRNSTVTIVVIDFFKKRFPNTSKFFIDSFKPIAEVGKSFFTQVKNDAAIINSHVKTLSSKIKDNTKLKTQELIKNIKDKILNNQ